MPKCIWPIVSIKAFPHLGTKDAMDDDPDIAAIMAAAAAAAGLDDMDLGDDDAVDADMRLAMAEAEAEGGSDAEIESDGDQAEPPLAAVPGGGGDDDGEEEVQVRVIRGRQGVEENLPDYDAYWNDEYGEGDVRMLRTRMGPVHGGRRRPRDEDDDSSAAAAADDYGIQEVGRFIDDDPDEDDEVAEAEGMLLPSISTAGTPAYQRELWRALCRMGAETTRLLIMVVNEGQVLSLEEQRRCKVWIKYWTSYMVEHHHQVLGRVISTPTGPDGAVERMTGTAAMMCELWRLRMILNYHRLSELKK